MKLTVKTLKGSHFEIRVHPTDTVMAVKKNIEDVQGKDNYPCGQQLLIHNGKVLKDETTLVDNKVSEDGFLVVMLSKSKTLGSTGASSTQPSTTAPSSNSTPATEAPIQPLASKSVSASNTKAANVAADRYDQAASNSIAGKNLEETIQHIMDIGGSNWDKETVARALRAANNNPERAVDYLYSGYSRISTNCCSSKLFPPANQATNVASAATVSGRPNSSPLNMFPQETPSGAGSEIGSLDFLRNNQQFSAFLDRWCKANPQILQPMLQELGKQNPQFLRLIQDHHAEFLQLINEPLDKDLLDQAEQALILSVSHQLSKRPLDVRLLNLLSQTREHYVDDFCSALVDF
ncbi:Ubiquitin-associated domain [Dillenia turbinata]|uniref:Ubiquitin-associated domain n=1 Tax=Dillenia turbinata TaxID=194707 RepID=A0AAN8U967_9MAGN